MCRNLQEGGRRCPHVLDPAKIAERNAKRRARYIPKTKGFLANIEKSLADSFQKAPIEEHPIFTLKAPNNATLYGRTEYGDVSPLGVSSRYCAGYLADYEYFTRKQISGLVDYTKLNENSYKEFGFQVPSEERKHFLHLDDIKRISAAELKPLTFGEKSALNFYTKSTYSWINKALFANGNPVLLETREDEETPQFNNENKEFDPKKHSITDASRRSTELLHVFTKRVDSAMSRAPLQQRVVYRGINYTHEAFHNYDWDNDFVENYVEKNYPLGREVKFDGYQSTSMNAGVAAGFASKNGLLFEIRTASGLNVSSVSSAGAEEEVLLPRDSRYMVVGVHKKVGYKTAGTHKDSNPTIPNITIVQLVEIDEKGYICDESHMNEPNPLTSEQLRIRTKASY
jgi:hypothetical protein